MTKSLPSRPDMEWLRKTAKQRLDELRTSDVDARLYQAQLALAQDYGFASWRALKAHVDTVSVDGAVLRATQAGDAGELARLLDEQPAKIHVRGGQWQRPLLHLAAEAGHDAVVKVLLDRGFELNKRDRWDNATALHWAAGHGRFDVTKRLLDAGADVHAEGDAHQAGVLGWAVQRAHRDTPRIGALLLERGARHSIFTAVALCDGAAVRALVAKNPALANARMSRFEQHQTPLHLAVRRNLPDMVELLLALGADACEPDGEGATPMRRVTRASDPRVERALLQAGATPEDPGGVPFQHVTPILAVKNIAVSKRYYADRMGWSIDVDMGDFVAIRRDTIRIFLIQDEAQGNPGTYLHIWVGDVDALHEELLASGAMIKSPPQNYPWGDRELLVTDSDGHVIRFSGVVRDG